MWSDNETEQDFLNFSGVADTVAEIIVQAKGRPISIGVSGRWGVGKSSMIKLIRKALAGRAGGNESKFVFVEFNAWLYQGYDDARAALMDVIASALRAEAERRKTGVEKTKELLKRVDWLRAAKIGAGSALALTLGVPPTGLIGEIFELGKKLGSAKIDEKVIAEAEKTEGDVESAATSIWKPKATSSPPKEIQALRKNFEDALSEMDIALVVLIDDLDRCLAAPTWDSIVSRRDAMPLGRAQQKSWRWDTQVVSI